MPMNPFKPKIFALLESRHWWYKVEPWDRLMFLKMLDIACSVPYAVPGVVNAGPGPMWRLAVGDPQPQRRLGQGVVVTANHQDANEHERAMESINRLIMVGALDELDVPHTRFVYRLRDFELFADALDTHRAASRRYARAKRRAQEQRGEGVAS